jgi:hypothetical protein
MRSSRCVEAVRDDVHGVLGHLAVRGELAAVHPYDAGRAHGHLVLPRQVGGLGASLRQRRALHEWSQSGPHARDVVAGDPL